MSKVFPKVLERVVQNLARLPGLGEKSATRLALFLLGQPKEETQELAHSLLELVEKVRLCKRCFNFAEEEWCRFCLDPERNKRQICIVEDPAALSAIEESKAYKGLYHVLHGLLSPRDGLGPREIKIEALLERLEREPVEEILIALSPTVAGEATAAYLVECLKPYSVKVTRIACGIPMGMDIRYADQLTLKRALESRQRL